MRRPPYDAYPLDDCVFYLRKRRAKRRFGTIEKQANELVFPLEVVFGHFDGFEEWLDQVLELRDEGADASKELNQKLRDLRKTWVQNIEDYEFPVVTLAEETEAEAVCTVFFEYLEMAIHYHVEVENDARRPTIPSSHHKRIVAG